MIPVPPQEILRKFEFFPIKCRIQRAAEVFRAALREDPLTYTHGHHGQQPCKQLIKTKVREQCGDILECMPALHR